MKPMEFSALPVYRDSNTRSKNNDLLEENSRKSPNFPRWFLMEEIKPVVTPEDSFQNRQFFLEISGNFGLPRFWCKNQNEKRNRQYNS